MIILKALSSVIVIGLGPGRQIFLRGEQGGDRGYTDQSLPGVEVFHDHLAGGGEHQYFQ